MRMLQAFFFLGLWSIPCFGIDGPEVIKRQQNRFEGLQNISAKFKKRHYWKLVDQATEIKGRLYVLKPDRFRFETDVQTVVTDGKSAWNYVPENEQVLLSTYEKMRGDRSYEKLLFDLILLGGYADRFDVRYREKEKVDGKQCHVVELMAKQEDSYVARVRLWVDQRLWLVRKVEYLNINEDVTTYELTGIQVDKKMKEALFSFKTPEGVEMIDLR